MYVEANAKDYIDHMSLEAPPPPESKPNGLSAPMRSLDISGDGCDEVHFLFLIEGFCKGWFPYTLLCYKKTIILPEPQFS